MENRIQAPAMGPVLHSFEYAIDFLFKQVADVAPADMTAQPAGIVNHPTWVTGHLTVICQELGGVIGLTPWLPEEWAAKFGSGTAPVPEPGAYEPKDQALERLRDARSRVVEAVSQLSETQLDEPFPDPSYLAIFPSVRHFLTQVLVGHAAYHVGQIGVWRRAMGLPPLGESFE